MSSNSNAAPAPVIPKGIKFLFGGTAGLVGQYPNCISNASLKQRDNAGDRLTAVKVLTDLNVHRAYDMHRLIRFQICCGYVYV